METNPRSFRRGSVVWKMLDKIINTFLVCSLCYYKPISRTCLCELYVMRSKKKLFKNPDQNPLQKYFYFFIHTRGNKAFPLPSVNFELIYKLVLVSNKRPMRVDRIEKFPATYPTIPVCIAP